MNILTNYIHEYKNSFDSSKQNFIFNQNRFNLFNQQLSDILVRINDAENAFDKISYNNFIKHEKECQLLIQDANDPINHFFIGKCLIEGQDDFFQNMQVGIKYLNLSMKNGNLDSAIYFCRLLIKGAIIPTNLKKAKKILEIHLKNECSIYSLLYGKI